jgi:3-methyladenine DNA glycosylase/8-oxoguanine DNA glycosylase
VSIELQYAPDQAIAHLSRRDRRLGSFIRRAGAFELHAMSMPNTFEYLCRAIVYQQLSTKAAATIHGRLRDLFPRRRISPSLLVSMPDAALRGAGMSRAKVAAVRDLAAHAAARHLPSRARLQKMDDETAIAALSQIRGIGRWTVEMLLLFPLGRPDVLPVTDLGVRKGFQLIFGGDELPTPDAVYSRGERWRPYRSVASWYMYRAVHMERGE